MADQKIIGMCPRCGSSVVESPRAYGCESNDCKAVIFKDNKYFNSIGLTLTEEVATELFNEGQTFAKGLVSKRTGNTYDAYVKVNFEGEGWPQFSMEFPPRDNN